MKTKLYIIFIFSILCITGCSDIPEYTQAGKILPTGTITINDNYFYTQSMDAVLRLDVENVNEMCFSTDGITYTPWETYDTIRNITLPAGHGVKTVYGKFRNGEGESVITDSIISLKEKKITASDGTSNAYFGGGSWGHTTANVVFSYDGNTMMTSSAPNNKVYIFKKNSNIWSESEVINCPELGSGLFGQSIACTPDEEYFVIGALSKARIYIYKMSGGLYSLIKTIDSPTPLISNDYSVTVSCSDDGNRILVGSWGNNSGKGKAYLYEKTDSNWASYSTKEFEDSNGNAGDHFGLGVKISGDGKTIAISAAHKNSYSGSVFIYKLNGAIWSEEEHSGLPGDMIGRHIGMSYNGQRIVAGTRCWTNGNANQGTAYLFEWDGLAYNETYKFTASDGVADDKFGYSVAMSSDGNSIVIGATFTQVPIDKGKAYVFRYRNSTWIEEAIISGSDSSAGEFYGNITAISGDGSVIAVSSPMDTIDANTQQGSVYLYY